MYFYFPKTNKRIAVYNEAHIYSYNASVERKTVFATYNIEYQLVYAGLHTAGSYFIPLGTYAKMEILVGLSTNFLAHQKSRLAIDFVALPAENSEAIEEYRYYDIGILIGLGFKINKWGFDIRFNPTSGFSPYGNAQAVTKTTGIGLTYLLN